MTELKQHPLSTAFPAMNAEDFAALVDDIKANGQRDPVMVHEGMVLDGWHRYRACLQIGVKPQQFTFPADKDPVAFVLSHNLHRRHLTPSQRAAAVVACSEWHPANVKKGRGEPGSPHTNADMAKVAQVSEKTIKDAKAAHKAGLTDAVKAGALTVKEAGKVARGKTEPAPEKAKREAQQKPAEVPDLTDADQLAEARDTLAQIAQENEHLRDRLAIEAMDASEDEKTQASETIAELREQVRILEIELDGVKSSRDAYMRENAELKKQVGAQRRELDRFKKVAA